MGGGGKEGRREKREREGEGEVCKVSLMSGGLQVNFNLHKPHQCQTPGAALWWLLLLLLSHVTTRVVALHSHRTLLHWQ